MAIVSNLFGGPEVGEVEAEELPRSEPTRDR